MKKTMVVALDLEMNQPSGKIIQLGAVIGDCKTGQVFSKLLCMVNPSEPLAPSITGLTGITEAQVQSAQKLPYVTEVLRCWLAPWDKQRMLNPVTWGGGDSRELQTQLKVSDEDFARFFGRRWLDAKTVYSAWALANNKDPIGGLEKSMSRMGLPFQGRAHNALVDAENTFRIWCKLVTAYN